MAYDIRCHETILNRHTARTSEDVFQVPRKRHTSLNRHNNVLKVVRKKYVKQCKILHYIDFPIKIFRRACLVYSSQNLQVEVQSHYQFSDWQNSIFSVDLWLSQKKYMLVPYLENGSQKDNWQIKPHIKKKKTNKSLIVAEHMPPQVNEVMQQMR